MDGATATPSSPAKKKSTLDTEPGCVPGENCVLFVSPARNVVGVRLLVHSGTNTRRPGHYGDSGDPRARSAWLLGSLAQDGVRPGGNVEDSRTHNTRSH